MSGFGTNALVRFMTQDDPVGQGAGCRETLTFDRKGAAVPGMRLLGAGSDH